MKGGIVSSVSWLWMRRHGWILAVGVAYFLALSATLLYKHHYLLNDWPFDEAYMIQQFHNWRSGYPKVTIQPGDSRSGFPGERPFEENHKKRIYALFRAVYWIWPYPETLILLYAFLVSLSAVSLYAFLNQLSLGPGKTIALVSCWMLYPLQQRIAAYTFCDPLSMTGTFYFFYLHLLCRNSPYAILGGLGLLLPREQVPWLILPTILLFPRKWKTLLWHLACIAPFLLLVKSGTGNPFAYAAENFHLSFIGNFVLSQTVLWALALVNTLSLVIAAAFMLIMIGVGSEIYFRFPCQFVGSIFRSFGNFYYYGLLMPPLMAALALGIAKLKPNQTRRLHLSLALLLVPGITYALCQLRYLVIPRPEARQIQAFLADSVPTNAVVVTDYTLSAAFANRDQIYVLLQPPRGVTLFQVFSSADIAIIPKTASNQIESSYLRRSTNLWERVTESQGYVFYRKTSQYNPAADYPLIR